MGPCLRPNLFIASSVEARPAAERIASELMRFGYDVQLWSEDFFQAGSSTYSAVATRIRDFDGGIFVLSPDDGYLSRSGPGWTARPNVVFELGMFAGVLDIGNCIQVRLKVRGNLPHTAAEIPRATIEDISDLAGITWIEADAKGQTNNGRTTFELTDLGIQKIQRAFESRRIRDHRALSHLQNAEQLMVSWEEQGSHHVCPAQLMIFGDRARVRFTWRPAQRVYDVSLKYDGEDRLNGSWWDSSDRGYAGHASFQVRTLPQYLLGKWLGWSANGGVKAGDFLIFAAPDEQRARKDHERLLMTLRGSSWRSKLFRFRLR